MPVSRSFSVPMISFVLFLSFFYCLYLCLRLFSIGFPASVSIFVLFYFILYFVRVPVLVFVCLCGCLYVSFSLCLIMSICFPVFFSICLCDSNYLYKANIFQVLNFHRIQFNKQISTSAKRTQTIALQMLSATTLLVHSIALVTVVSKEMV